MTSILTQIDYKNFSQSIIPYCSTVKETISNTDKIKDIFNANIKEKITEAFNISEFIKQTINAIPTNGCSTSYSAERMLTILKKTLLKIAFNYNPFPVDEVTLYQTLETPDKLNILFHLWSSLKNPSEKFKSDLLDWSKKKDSLISMHQDLLLFAKYEGLDPSQYSFKEFLERAKKNIKILEFIPEEFKKPLFKWFVILHELSPNLLVSLLANISKKNSWNAIERSLGGLEKFKSKILKEEGLRIALKTEPNPSWQKVLADQSEEITLAIDKLLIDIEPKSLALIQEILFKTPLNTAAIRLAASIEGVQLNQHPLILLNQFSEEELTCLSQFDPQLNHESLEKICEVLNVWWIAPSIRLEIIKELQKNPQLLNKLSPTLELMEINELIRESIFYQGEKELDERLIPGSANNQKELTEEIGKASSIFLYNKFPNNSFILKILNINEKLLFRSQLKNPYNLWESFKEEPLLITSDDYTIPMPIGVSNQMNFALEGFKEQTCTFSWSLAGFRTRAKGYAVKDIPSIPDFSTSFFTDTFNKIEEHLENKEQDLSDLGILLSFPALKSAVLDKGFLPAMLTLPEDPEKLIDQTVFYLYTSIRAILDKSSLIPEGKLFSPQEEAFLSLCSMISSCNTGVRDGIDAFYLDLPREYKKVIVNSLPSQTEFSSIESSSSQTRQAISKIVWEAIEEPLASVFNNGEIIAEILQEVPEQLSHQNTYVKNRYYKQFGINYAVFDFYTHHVSEKLINDRDNKFLKLCLEKISQIALSKAKLTINEGIAKRLINPTPLFFYLQNAVPEEERKGRENEEWLKEYAELTEDDEIKAITDKGLLIIFQKEGYLADFKIQEKKRELPLLKETKDEIFKKPRLT